MKNIKDILNELLFAIIILILLLLFINPTQIWMPDEAHMMITGAFAIIFMIFGALIWREYPKDERESLHSLTADRYAFLVGSTLIAVGIVVQYVNHSLDNWLPATLAAMIISKFGAIIYARIRN